MASAPAERDSQMLRRSTGFRADLLGLDLPSVLQLVCVSRERRVLRVGSGDLLGFIFVSDGRPAHALVEGNGGEISRGVPAALRILAWQDGDVCLCDRAFPTGSPMDLSIEELLLRSAQASDEAQTAAKGLPALPAAAAKASEVSRTNVATLRPAPLREASREASRESQPPPTAVEPRVNTNVPEPPRWRDSVPTPVRESAAVVPLAAARLDMNGRLVSSQGNAQLLAQLVAYITRMAAIVAHHLALEPFEALEAELGQLRLVVFVDGSDMVGLLLPPGATFSELRQQLSV